MLAVNQAEPLCALGRWDEALTIASGAMDLYLAPGPMHRALLQVITGFIALARDDQVVAARAVLAARDALGSARYEDQHQLPLARLEILFVLAKDGPAAALGTASQIMDRFELSGRSPRYAWPVVTAGTSVVLAAARRAGVAHDERLRDEAASLAERLRTVAEKLGTFGPAQRAFQLTFAAADAYGAPAAASAKVHPGRSGRPAGGDGGEPAGLLAAWDEAAAAWADLGEPYPLSQTLLLAAEAALACGDRDGAAERLRRALPLAAGLGAHPLTEQIAILARRARIRLARRRRRTPEGPGDPAAGWRARPDRTRTRGAPPGRGRAQQPGDSRRAVHLAQDGQRPRVQHPRQAGRRQPRRGRRQGAHRSASSTPSPAGEGSLPLSPGGPGVLRGP